MLVYIEGLHHSFGKEEVLRDLSLSVERGSFVTIIGPSGAGKTTLLKLIAGLDTPSAGRVRIQSERDLRRHPPILVFQDYMLFPYLNVFENIAFGLRARRRRRDEIHARVREMLSFFQLEGKEEAYPRTLSGGQQQRVALARALVIQPEVLLLDEPYANLDRNLKMETAAFLRRTQRRFGITTICVTHDIDEALAVSDALGILIAGRMEDYGPPERVYSRPRTLSAGRFLGALNEFKPELYALLGLQTDSPCVYVRSESLELLPDQQGEGKITAARFVGKAYVYELDLAGTGCTAYSALGGLAPGDRVRVRLRQYLVPSGERGGAVLLHPETDGDAAPDERGEMERGEIRCREIG